jgi:hypothetical protein
MLFSSSYGWYSISVQKKGPFSTSTASFRKVIWPYCHWRHHPKIFKPTHCSKPIWYFLWSDPSHSHCSPRQIRLTPRALKCNPTLFLWSLLLSAGYLRLLPLLVLSWIILTSVSVLLFAILLVVLCTSLQSLIRIFPTASCAIWVTWPALIFPFLKPFIWQCATSFITPIYPSCTPFKPMKHSSAALQTHWSHGFAKYLSSDFGDGLVSFADTDFARDIRSCRSAFPPIFSFSMVPLSIGVTRSNLLLVCTLVVLNCILSTGLASNAI